MADRPALDPSQRRVAEADPDARLIVTAAAGQGKTEVVSARLAHLVLEAGLGDTDEVLVLSFSRAAVAAVRDRLRADPRGIRSAVRTFDSFASLLLGEAGKEITGRFEQRIRAATRLLADTASDLATIDLLRHVVVDEVQDLVGDRAELVHALLSRLPDDAGFTVLGDPLQGIYDFQLDDSTVRTTSAELLDRLRRDLGATDERLEHHHRAQSRDADAVVSLGRRMRATTSGRSRLNKIRHHIDSLPSVGSLNDFSRMLPRWSGRTAVLCSTNGEALTVSRELYVHGVPHRLRRPAEQISIPSWVAAILAGAPSRGVTRVAFDDLVTASGINVPDDAWRLLKTTERRRHIPRELDLVELSRAIADGIVPVDLVDSGNASLVVSTVHRAKGLEFDNVVILEGRERRKDEPTSNELDARARVLYVALSRARNLVTMVQPPAAGRPFRDPRTKRWVRGVKWRTSAFEVGLHDIERRRPYDRGVEAARKVQDLLKRDLRTPGHAMTGRLVDGGDPAVPVYEISADGHAVAFTSHEFGTTLTRRLRSVWANNPGPPAALGDLYGDGIETVAGPPMVGEQLGIGRWGLWLAPRVSGLARLEFRKDDDA